MADFPTFSGCAVHIPWTAAREFANIHNNMGHGYRYSYNVVATPVRSWQIQFLLSDDDWATLLAFWESMAGAYGEFNFTDPDTTVTHTRCRFDGDSLDVVHRGPNDHLVTVKIQEYVG